MLVRFLRKAHIGSNINSQSDLTLAYCCFPHARRISTFQVIYTFFIEIVMATHTTHQTITLYCIIIIL